MLTASVIRATIRPILWSRKFDYFLEVTIQGGITDEKMQHVEKNMDCFVGRIHLSHRSKHGLRRRPCGCHPPEAAEGGTGQPSGLCSGGTDPETTE
jgi:hypothetical protein